jgi:hypothetical protein
MSPEIIRGVERLLGVLIGGFTVYLGFRLFLALPRKTDSSGRVALPGGVNIYLSRIGPGAFFAIFGCTLVGISFQQQVKVDRVRQMAPADGTTIAVTEEKQSYLGVGSAVPGASAEQRALRLKDARATLASLNRLAPALLDQLPASDRNSLRLALEHSKLALVESVWESDWGSFGAFREWIRSGRLTPLPDSVRREAAELFDQGRTATPR